MIYNLRNDLSAIFFAKKCDTALFTPFNIKLCTVNMRKCAMSHLPHLYLAPGRWGGAAGGNKTFVNL